MKEHGFKVMEERKPIAQLKLKSFLSAVGLIFILILSTTIVTASSSKSDSVLPFPRNEAVPDGPDVIDATVDMLGVEEKQIRGKAAIIGSAEATRVSSNGESANVGEEITMMGSGSSETFVVVMKGTYGIVLVDKASYDNYDSATDEYIFDNPYGDGNPEYPLGRLEDRISTTQLKYLLDQFDTVIYPKDTSIFGQPLSRGPEGQKTWILVHNIKDEAYYDPIQTMYVAGYFSASEEAFNNKNIMHIDSFDWKNRIGPNVARPFLYEGVFAHEFQHLIHFDIDPDEEIWVNEGLADLAGYLCGYGHPAGHIAYYMVYHPIVSLTFWGGGLEDYGANYLFQLYLYEHYGNTKFTTALVKEPANGIEGIEKTLAALGYKDTFDNIFDHWTIANYLDDTKTNDGIYGYKTLDIGTDDTWGYSIEYALSNKWWGIPNKAPFNVNSGWFWNLFGIQGIEPLPYTVDYFRFNNDKTAKISMDGQDFVGTQAKSGTYEWYSDSQAWAWRSFYRTFEIPDSGATLKFSTHYDIEPDWDYGYVEIYDRNTGEWYTLNSEGTVDYIANPQDNPNTPIGREPTDYKAAGRWHAFTGKSKSGWDQVSMDLSPFAGHKIDLYFTTWQDGAANYQMMYVDDISIPEIGFSDDIEAGENGWTSTGWRITDGIVKNGIGVITVDSKWVPTARFPEPAGNSATELNSIRQMQVNSTTQNGVDKVPATPDITGRVQVAIASNHARHILPSSYKLKVSW